MSGAVTKARAPKNKHSECQGGGYSFREGRCPFLFFLIPNENVTGDVSDSTSQWSAVVCVLVCVCAEPYEGVCVSM